MKEILPQLERAEALLDLALLEEVECRLKALLIEKEQRSDLYYMLARSQLAQANHYLMGDDPEKSAEALEKARFSCEQAISMGEAPSDTHRILGVCYGRLVGQGRLTPIIYGPKARRELEKALGKDQNNMRAIIGLGIWYLKAPAIFGGDLKKAEESLQRALRKDPKSWEALVWLGIAAVKKGDMEKAEELFARACKIRPIRKLIIRELEREGLNSNR